MRKRNLSAFLPWTTFAIQLTIESSNTNRSYASIEHDNNNIMILGVQYEYEY